MITANALWFDRGHVIERVARLVIKELEEKFLRDHSPKFVAGNTVVVNLFAAPVFGGWEKLDRERIFTGPCSVHILATPSRPNTSYIHEQLTHYWDNDENYDKCRTEGELKDYMFKRIHSSLGGTPALYWSYTTDHPVVKYELAEPFLVLAESEEAQIVHRRFELEETIRRLSGELRESEKKAKDLSYYDGRRT